MFSTTAAFSGFSVDDIARAEEFYGQTLGLNVTKDGQMGFLSLKFAGGGTVMIYPKDNHEPATFTIMNFPVSDIDRAVDGLAAKGVTFERYDMPGVDVDAKGIHKDQYGPRIAWFKDPAGNILSVLEDTDAS